MTPVATPLSVASRTSALARLASSEVDVLVVGGGVVGCGTALDAATRGLSVGLLEARDFAAGTSSRSSKLVHGGLRYLKQVNLHLVFEALRERKLILETLAPHLAKPVPFVYPLERRIRDRLYVGLGVGVYDVLGAGRGVPSHMKHLSEKRTLEVFRGGKPGAVKGGVFFYEGHLDDARHTMALARTAAAYGALVASSTQATGFLHEGDRVVGVVATDLETGGTLQLRAKCVINATGVWTDEVQHLLGVQTNLRVHASKGVHLTVPRDRIHSETGLITETEKSLLFVIPCPWDEDFWVIGTTDTTWSLDLAHPAATKADIDYILDHVNKLLDVPLTPDDVVGVFAGLRPLVAAADQTDSSKLSREHAVLSPARGSVIVVGGKYTTYRVMAKDAVDAAVKDLPGLPARPSRTEHVPLVGAEGYPELVTRRTALAAEQGISVPLLDHLLGRYGTAVLEVFELIRQDPELGRPLAGAPRYLRAEAHYAVSHEGALHLEDILTRRLRVSVDTPSRGVEAATEVAEIVAPLLGWDAKKAAEEVALYTERVQAERESQQQPDDATADSIRTRAHEARHPVTLA